MPSMTTPMPNQDVGEGKRMDKNSSSPAASIDALRTNVNAKKKAEKIPMRIGRN